MTVIYQEYQNKNLGYRLVCKGEILKLIAYLARQYTAQVLTDSESDKRKETSGAFEHSAEFYPKSLHGTNQQWRYGAGDSFK